MALRHTTTILMVAITVMVVLSSCSGSPITALQPGLLPAPAAESIEEPAGYPGFPGDAGYPVSILRSALDAEIAVPGDGFVDEEGAENGPGDSGPSTYVIAPGAEDDLAWAVFGIGGFDADRPVSIDLEIMGAPLSPGGDDPLPLSAWIGLSNYSQNSWEWYGPYEEPTSLVLNSTQLHERYVSSTNSFYYTVVTDSSLVDPQPGNPDGTSAVEIIVATTTAIAADSPEYIPTAPIYPEVTSGGLGAGKAGSALDPTTQFVTLAWDHYADSASTDNEATQYDVYRRWMDGNEGLALLGTTNAPDTEFTDPTDKRPLIADVIPGETYEYTVVARNASGSTPFAHAGTITIPLLPPGNLSASFGTRTDGIQLDWEPVEGSTRYQVYRDTTTTPIATIGNVLTWLDTTVPDGNEHTYWVRGVNQYNHGGNLSAATNGRKNEQPVADAAADTQAGDAPLDVLFDAENSFDPDNNVGVNKGIVNFEWDFNGDGTADSDKKRDTYTYNAFGDFTARLTVTDSGGAAALLTIDIHVNAVPVADLIAFPATPPTNGWDFDASNSSDPDSTSGNGIVNYSWDFNGDNFFSDTVAEIQNEGIPDPQNILIPVGAPITVSVKVFDADGSSDTASKLVTP